MRQSRLSRPVEVVTPPAANFLEDARVWDHLRVPLSGSPEAPADETQIALYRNAAQAALDGPQGTLGRALITQTLRMTLDAFPLWTAADAGERYLQGNGAIRLPCPPVVSVTSIAYVDEAGATQTLAASKYDLIDNQRWPSIVVPAWEQDWPATRDVPAAVTVTWTAGYGAAASDVPQNIVAAGLEMVRMLYEGLTGRDREGAQATVEALIAKDRVRGFG